MKAKIKKGQLFFLILAIGIILAFAFLSLCLKSLIEKEAKQIIRQSGEPVLTGASETIAQAHLENLRRLQKERIERYFLSEVEWTESGYMLAVHNCLFAGGQPIYPLYIYERWSYLAYPDFSPQIALVRYLLLPEDNPTFQLNKSCFIKEIKTEEDWQEVEEKYGFFRYQF